MQFERMFGNKSSVTPTAPASFNFGVDIQTQEMPLPVTTWPRGTILCDLSMTKGDKKIVPREVTFKNIIRLKMLMVHVWPPSLMGQNQVLPWGVPV